MAATSPVSTRDDRAARAVREYSGGSGMQAVLDELDDDDSPEDRPDRESARAEARARGLLVIAEPLVQQGLGRLRAGIAQICRGPEGSADERPFDGDSVGSKFLPGLVRRLRTLLMRTLVLELNVARVRGQLDGATPELRFDDFVRSLCKPDVALALFDEYPVLARLLVTTIDQWVDASLELLRRLCDDWTAIREAFAIPAGARVVRVRMGAGDTHREGRSVCVIQFDTAARIVYKPHSLSAGVHFGQLLGWLSERGLSTDLHRLRALDRDTYGWTEFLEHRACESEDGVRRFYRRLGALAAIAHVLRATDLHWENVVAWGEHPVLVDLETVLHPALPAGGGSSVAQTTLEAQEQSALRTGLLPERIWMRGDGDGIDLSGMGGTGDRLAPIPATVPEGEGTDTMRFVSKRVRMPKSQNQPHLRGEGVSAGSHASEVLAGFEEAYRLLWRSRDEILAEGGPFSWFRDDEVRVLVRPTQVYAQVLANAFHPNALRRQHDHDTALDRLRAGVERRPELARVIASEQADLATGNIPLFVTKPCSRSVTGSGGTEVPDFLPEPSMTAASACLRELSEVDLARQLWFVRGSMASLDPVGRHGTQAASGSYRLDAAASEDELLHGAKAIVDRLTETAFHKKDHVVWMGVTPVSRDYWAIGPSGFDLYSGTAGIALFLGYAGAVLRDPRARELAEKAIYTAIDQAREARQASPKGPAILGMGGMGGLLYAIAHLGSLWGDAALLRSGRDIVELSSGALESDRALDIIGGSAGYLCALLALEEAERCATASAPGALLQEATRVAEYLLRSGQTVANGIAWNTTPDSIAPLTGFSHGASGIGYALLRLHALSPDDRYRDAAVRAFSFERTQFDPAQKNWYDFRNLPGANLDNPLTAVAWCHGAPGIGLARVFALKLAEDPSIRADLEAALTTTWQSGFPTGHSLCHGDLGNLDLFLEADEVLPQEEWTTRARRVAAAILASVSDSGWSCGTPSGVETPEFMVGLSGIGYGLLRLAEPRRVPSALALDPARPDAAGRGGA